MITIVKSEIARICPLCMQPSVQNLPTPLGRVGQQQDRASNCQDQVDQRKQAAIPGVWSMRTRMKTMTTPGPAMPRSNIACSWTKDASMVESSPPCSHLLFAVMAARLPPLRAPLLHKYP